jgi:hypothetical protein
MSSTQAWQGVIGLILAATANMTTAAQFDVDAVNSGNGILDIYSATFDGPMVPPADPLFGGTRPPTVEVIINPAPTGVISGIVPLGITPEPAAGSFLDLTLGNSNTELTIQGGTISFPDLTLTVSITTEVLAEGAGMVFEATPVIVSDGDDGSVDGVFVLEVGPPFGQLEQGTKVDFSDFSVVAPPQNCSGPLCGAISVLTLDMVRYRLIIDWDPTFNFFTADFVGQTSNNSMVFSTLNSVVPSPDITVTDSVVPVDDLQIPFGDVTEATSTDEMVTVTNDGNANLLLGQITQPAAQFTVLNDNCSNQTLIPNADCTVTVRFEPNATGVVNSSFDIPSNDADENPVTMDVSGTGTAVLEPEITITDSVPPTNDLQVPFGDVTVAAAADETITVTNSGTADLIIGQLTSPAAPFSVLNDTCSNQTLAPAANCGLTVRFAPAAASASADSFDIPSNDPNTAVATVNISGAGTLALVPKISVKDSVAPATDLQVPFGDVAVAPPTPPDETVTVTNIGTGDLTIGLVTQPPLPFSLLDDTCSNQTLIAAADCTLSVRFDPAVAGTFATSFDIPSNDSNNPTATIDISGTGVVPEMTVTDSVDPFDDLRIPFGNVIATMSSTETVTVTNSGVVDLTLGQVTLADTFGVFSILTNNCASPQNIVMPGDSCTVDVNFSPGTVGDFAGSLDILSDDPNMAVSTVLLDGTGTSSPAPEISVSDTVPPVDDLMMPFGNVTEATAWDRSVTITNDGNGNLQIGQIAQIDTLINTFSILNDNCSSQIIAPAANCTVEVRFLPSRVDTFSDSFDIPSNDPDEPSLTFSVSGSGVAVGHGTIDLTPDGADSGLFGSAIKPVTLCALLGLIAVNLRRRRYH